MLKNIKVTNKGGSGESINFDNRYLRIVDGLDLSGTVAEVNFSESNVDGSIYQNTRLKNAEFDIVFNIMRHLNSEVIMDDKRAMFFRVMNPKANPIRIDFEDSIGDKYYIMAELISTPVMSPDKQNNNAAFQKGLLQFIATDPFVYATAESFTDIATWIPNFEFILEIPEEGIEMGYREVSLIKNVVNEGSEEIGMIIEFYANSSLTNPYLINVNTYEQLKLNTEMQTGDKIVINTRRRQKSIKLIRDNVEYDYFSKLDYLTSMFIQLHPGDNLLRYGADAGEEYLEVRVSHRNQYVGV